MEDVAGWLIRHYTHPVNGDPYPGAVIGSMNAAMARLCALARMPWLPQTILLPLRWGPRCWSSLPAAGAWGILAAAAFYGRNPEVALHQSHDAWDGTTSMCRAPRMWAKLRRLPRGYATFLAASLARGAPVILLHDESTWPTTRLGERHVLQVGSLRTPAVPEGIAARNGMAPGRAGWTDTLVPDGLSPDAEWGFDPDLASDIARWCAINGHPLYRVRIPGPQALSSAAADIGHHSDGMAVSGVLRVVSATGVSVNRCDASPDG